MSYTTRSKMLTTSGVAKLLHLHINTVRRWSDEGILKPYRIGTRGDRRYYKEDVLHFLVTQKYSNVFNEKHVDISSSKG